MPNNFPILSKKLLKKPIKKFRRLLKRFRAKRPSKVETNRTKILFCFGPAYLASSTRLMLLSSMPMFRQIVSECDNPVKRFRGWSPVEKFLKGAPFHQHVSTFEQQLFHEVIFELALCGLYSSWGLKPDGVTGISLGEIVCGYAAQTLTLEETLHVTSVFCDTVLRTAKGKVVRIAGPPLQEKSFWKELSIEVHHTLQGLNEQAYAVSEEEWPIFQATLSRAGIPFNLIDLDYLAHTPRIDRESILQNLSFIKGRQPACRLYSCGMSRKATKKLDAGYWADILRNPVDFTNTGSRIFKDGYEVIIQVGGPAHYWARAFQPFLAKMERPVSVMPFYHSGENYGVLAEASKVKLQDLGLIKSLQIEPHPSGTVDSRSQIDLNSERFFSDPYACFRSWREIAPVHLLPKQKGWLVLDYEDIVSILKQPKLYSAEPYKQFSELVSGNDPPDHTRVRNLLTPYFSDDSSISKITSRHLEFLIDDLKTKARFEVMETLARPLPMMVMCELLGIDSQRAKEFLHCAQNQLSLPQLQSFLGNNGGILQRMFAAKSFRDHEILELATFFVKAGVKTVTDAIGNTIFRLLHFPEVMQQIRNDLDLVPALVEELLRLDPAVFIVQRKSRQTTRISGVEIPEGALIFMPIGSANRDPKHFEEPDQLILNRKNSKALTFGAGPHYCLGSTIGLIELEMLFHALSSVLPAFRSACELDQIKFRGNIFIREPIELPVKFVNAV